MLGKYRSNRLCPSDRSQEGLWGLHIHRAAWPCPGRCWHCWCWPAVVAVTAVTAVAVVLVLVLVLVLARRSSPCACSALPPSPPAPCSRGEGLEAARAWTVLRTAATGRYRTSVAGTDEPRAFTTSASITRPAAT